MKYIHVLTDHYYQGLPIGDLDDKDLNDEQKILLAAAVKMSVYAPLKEAGKKVKGEQHQGEAENQ